MLYKICSPIYSISVINTISFSLIKLISIENFAARLKGQIRNWREGTIATSSPYGSYGLVAIRYLFDLFIKHWFTIAIPLSSLNEKFKFITSIHSINICYSILTTHIKYSFANGFLHILLYVNSLKILLLAGRLFSRKSCSRIQPANANTEWNHYEILQSSHSELSLRALMQSSHSELLPAPVALEVHRVRFVCLQLCTCSPSRARGASGGGGTFHM